MSSSSASKASKSHSITAGLTPIRVAALLSDSEAVMLARLPAGSSAAVVASRATDHHSQLRLYFVALQRFQSCRHCEVRNAEVCHDKL